MSNAHDAPFRKNLLPACQVTKTHYNLSKTQGGLQYPLIVVNLI